MKYVIKIREGQMKEDAHDEPTEGTWCADVSANLSLVRLGGFHWICRDYRQY
jgi:hypothetical protein